MIPGLNPSDAPGKNQGMVMQRRSKPRFSLIAFMGIMSAITGFVSGHWKAKSPSTTDRAAFAMVSHLPVDGVAEIVVATPDGLTLVYTSSDAGRLGLIDLTDPANPKSLPDVDVRRMGIGEPTSVAITPDGKYAVVAVRLGDDLTQAKPGVLSVYDISQPTAVKHVKDVTVGVGPDCVALAGAGKTLRAVVAIEDEETTPEGNVTIPGVRPGRIDVVGLQDLYSGTPTGVQSLELVAPATQAGIQFPADPQPEFIAIRQQTMQAVVSLQENNACAIVDLSNPEHPQLARVFSTGTVTRNGNADIHSDHEIAFTETFTGRREPDAVAWLTNSVFATANEGDTSLREDGIFPGARGFTLLDLNGHVVFESGAQTEQQAAIHGHYPDSRSAAKGVEIEGVATGNFGGAPYLMVGAERGSFVAVYRVDDIAAPKFVQLLPTGRSPEGLLTITNRQDGQQLFVTANELECSLTVFRFYPEGPPANPRDPQLVARDPHLAWGALSGLTTDGTHLFAVPDNAFGQSRIYQIKPHPASNQMRITSAKLLTLADGSPLCVDAEGIAKVAGGFWIAAEGLSFAENELIKVNDAGVVQERVKLPAELQARNVSPPESPGFEGVTASSDGRTLYVALQRGFDIANPFAAILKYDTLNGTWTSAQYPLDRHSKNAELYWTGISEVQCTADGKLLLLERDKGGEAARAINAEIKRIYSVNVADISDGATLTKTLVHDLRKEFNYLHEKPEGLVIFGGELWIVNDNDGAGWTRMLNAGKL